MKQLITSICSKRKSIIFFCFLLVVNAIFAQIPRPPEKTESQKRSERFRKMLPIYIKHKGVFKQVVSANHTRIAPGDSITISHYITGNGYINFLTAKIYFNTSANIFNDSTSIVYGGFNLEKDPDKLIEFGGTKHTLKDSKSIVNLSSYFPGVVSIDNVDIDTIEANLFYPRDLNKPYFLYSESETYSTVYNRRLSMLVWDLVTNDNIAPGDYVLTFVFTYFNGVEWKNDTEVLTLHVMSWYERDESKIKKLAYILAILSIFVTLIQTLKYVFKGARFSWTKAVGVWRKMPILFWIRYLKNKK